MKKPIEILWLKKRKTALDKWMRRVVKRCTVIINRSLRGTNRGIILLSALIAAIFTGVSSMEIGIPEPLAFITATVAVFFLYLLAARVTIWLLKAAFKIQPEYIVAVSLPFIGILGFFFATAFKASDNACILLGVLFSVTGILFARCSYAVFFKKACTRLNFFLLAVTTGGVAFMLTFLLGSGFSNDYISDYQNLNYESITTDNSDGSTDTGSMTKEDELLHLTVSDTAAAVSTVSYGTKDGENELLSGTVDLSTFVTYDGLTKRIRDFYWGFSINEVPMAGQVWYPEEGGNYPVLFIIHGNHVMTTDSHLGYAYLGEYLASQGYVVVSVDENFLNGYINFGLSNENDARAVLLLENIGQILKFNEDPSSLLYQKIDAEKIAIAGHSRGGEAVAVAALFNTYDRYPDNGGHEFDYHYAIQSVIAIAPTCDQYKPAGNTVELTNVNYLLLHGSNDQDVNSTMGLKQYENVTFQEGSDYFKSFLYIAGANHGQFNSLWGRYDRSFPERLLLNTKDLISEEDQQEICRTSIKLFLDATLLGESEKRAFFERYETTDVELPNTLYLQNYSDSSFEAVCDFEEDTDITTGSVEDVKLFAASMNYWGESRLSASSELYAFGFDNSAVSLRWGTAGASYLIDFSNEKSVADKKFLQFDVMNADNGSVADNTYSLLAMTVELVDSQGHSVSLSTAAYATIYPPLPVLLSKLEFLSNSYHYKQNLQTIRLPIEDFLEQGELNTEKITRIRIWFDQADTGDIKLDNVGFSN